MGRKVLDIVIKSLWVIAGLLMLFCLVIVLYGQMGGKDATKDKGSASQGGSNSGVTTITEINDKKPFLSGRKIKGVLHQSLPAYGTAAAGEVPSH